MPRDRAVFWTMSSFSEASAWKKKTHSLPAAISCHRQLGVGFGSSIPNPCCNIDWLDLAQVLCKMSQALWVPSPVVSGKTVYLWDRTSFLTLFWSGFWNLGERVWYRHGDSVVPYSLHLNKVLFIKPAFHPLSAAISHQLPIDSTPVFAASLRIHDKENKTLDALFISYWRLVKSLPYISCLWHNHPSHFTTLFCFRKYNWS